MKNYDKNKESSFLTYVDANNLYGWAMSRKLPVDEFKWVYDLSMFTEDFIKSYDKKVILVIYLLQILNIQKHFECYIVIYLFLPEKLKINKCTKLICNVTDKNNYSIHIVALKLALNHGLILKKVHIVISFRLEAWLKPYIDLNTELRKNAKKNLKKTFIN